MFNIYPALDVPEDKLDEPVIEETREEKMYRNWMNSMGVKPFVNYIYEDLSTGLIYFQVIQFILFYVNIIKNNNNDLFSFMIQ